jgi:chloramphenicol 3-O-phosphotransferase
VSNWDDVQVDSVFVNGTVGVGKTTLAAALSAIESVAHAVIDLDEIRRLSPAPTSDRFNHELELVNLRSLARNFRRAGAQRFIVAGVVEERSEIDRYVDALGSTGMFVCRLVASPDVLEDRLARRHEGDPEGLEWHRARAGELTRILDDSALDDLVVDTSETSVAELARVVRRATGWA